MAMAASLACSAASRKRNCGSSMIGASTSRDLMEIVEERYGRGSIMISSQLPTSAWHDVIGEPTFADAILDRIVRNAYRLELEGQSLRRTIIKMDDETPQTRYPKPTASRQRITGGRIVPEQVGACCRHGSVRRM